MQEIKGTVLKATAGLFNSKTITILASGEDRRIHKHLKDNFRFCKQISYHISIIIIQLSLFEM